MSESSRSLPSARTFYDEVGGAPTFTRLVARFYAGVRTDPVLAPALPAGRLGRRRGPAARLPRAVLGRPDHLLAGARPPAAADAARAVRDRPGRARRLAGATCATPSTPSSSRPSRTPRSGATWRWRRAACRTAFPAEAGGDLSPRALTPAGAACPRDDTPEEPGAPGPEFPRGRPLTPTGGGTRCSTRSTSAASPTGTATASATWPASGAGCRTWPTSASTPCGSRRSTPRRWPTTATTSPIRATSSRCSATSPSSTRCSPTPTRSGIRVTIDLVPNHSSDQHEWFQAALAAAPGSPERAPLPLPRRPRPGRQRAAEQLAVGLRRAGLDAGSPDGQWYLHLFAPEQPDLDFANPEVLADLEETMRFWLDRGRRRLPDRRRPRHGQARRPAGHAADGGHRPARRPRPRRPALRPGRRARGAPPDPRGARRVPGHDGRRRGVGLRRRPAGPVPARRTSCSWRSTSSC